LGHRVLTKCGRRRKVDRPGLVRHLHVHDLVSWNRLRDGACRDLHAGGVSARDRAFHDPAVGLRNRDVVADHDLVHGRLPGARRPEKDEHDDADLD
jgi:hypothetical protein